MNYIHEIIRRYVNRQYPRNLERKIQRWLCEDERAEAKEEALLRYWNETETVSDGREMKDGWKRISSRLGFKSTGSRWYRYGYAASFLICVLAVSLWLWNTGEASLIQTVTTGKGESKTVTLPDGSLVRLNPSSEIAFQKAYEDTVRRVRLKGEAWFDVVHLPEKPFIVNTRHLTTRVLGTRFSMNDYPEDGQAAVYLQTGAVEIIPAGQPRPHVLHPGEYLVYDKATHQIHVSERKPPYLYFRNASLEEIRNSLERRFNIPIILEGVSEERYTLEFDSTATVREVLETLCVLDEHLTWRTGHNQTIILSIKHE